MALSSSSTRPFSTTESITTTLLTPTVHFTCIFKTTKKQKFYQVEIHLQPPLLLAFVFEINIKYKQLTIGLLIRNSKELASRKD